MTDRGTSRALLAPGSRVDRFIVEQVLGEGGFAQVFGVRHAYLGTKHALKVLSGATPQAQQRLLREGVIQARVRSEHVVEVTDVIQVQGAPALLMPWVQGVPLSTLGEHHRPSQPEALALFRGIVSGVAAAHHAGVIHRDLKPSNVLLDLHRGRVRARVTDFGVARVLDHSSVLTHPGAFVGTPLYAAPEQRRGSPEVGPPADLWALGLLLLELTVGGPLRPTAVEQLHAGAPDPAFWATLPEALRPLLGGLLKPDPEHRTRDITVLVDALADLPEQPSALDLGSPLAESLRRLTAPPARAPTNDWATPWGAPEAAETLAESAVHTTRTVDRMVGREDELQALASALDHHRALVLLVGPAGVGKTRLARHYGRVHRHRWPGDVWFCDLAEARTAEGVATAVARALGIPLHDRDPVAQVGHAIAALGPCLLVLDNFEQVVPFAASTVGSWLERTLQAAFLVTTRQVLGLSGEQVLRLRPLNTDEAVALFLQRAQDARADFVPTDQDDLAIRQLAELLDGLPLAIELAAARIPLLRPTKLLERMKDRFRLLQGGGTRAARHRTLRAALDWSWDLLEEHERAALAQLSVFEGSFDVETAEDLLLLDDQAPWPLDVIQSLLEKSWVRKLPDERLILLGSVQAYARERLEAMDLAPTLEARHGELFAAFGRPSALEALDRHDGVAAWMALRSEADNLRAACRRALNRQDATVAGPSARALWALLRWIGPYPEATELLDRVIALPDLPESLVLPLRIDAAEAEWKQGRAEHARVRLDEALDLANRLGFNEPSLLALLRRTRGVVWRHLGRIEDSQHELKTALLLAQQAGQRRLEGTILARLAGGYRASGAMEAARQAYREALAAHREVGDRRSEGRTLGNLGELEQQLGALDDAERHLRAALTVHEEVGNRYSEGFTQASLAVLHQHQGDLTEALAHHQASLAAHRAVGNRRLEAVARTLLGTVHQHRGALDQAEEAYREALLVHRELGNRRGEAQVALNLGVLQATQGDVDGAMVQYADALAVQRDLGDRRAIGLVLLSQGMLQRDQAQMEFARQSLHEATAIFGELGDPRLHGLSLTALGDVCRLEGQLDQASSLLDDAEPLLRGGGRGVELGELLCARVELERARGQTEAALGHLKEATEIVTDLGADRTSDLAQKIRRLTEQA